MPTRSGSNAGPIAVRLGISSLQHPELVGDINTRLAKGLLVVVFDVMPIGVTQTRSPGRADSVDTLMPDQE